MFYKMKPTADVSAVLFQHMVMCPSRGLHPAPINEELHSPDVRQLPVLHCTSRKWLSDVKTRLQHRVVVLGGSTTGLAFIIELLKVHYLHFANIVLVSRDGVLPYQRADETSWWPNRLSFSPEDYATLSLQPKLRVVQGVMVDLDRQAKYIVTDGGIVEPYDVLLITVGRQYALPPEVSSTSVPQSGVFPLSHQGSIRDLVRHVQVNLCCIL